MGLHLHTQKEHPSDRAPNVLPMNELVAVAACGVDTDCEGLRG